MTDDYHNYFKIFTEVSKAIHSGTNTGDILKRIVTNIVDIMSAKGCIFWIINENERKIESKISHGFTYQSLSGMDYETLTRIFNRETEKTVFIEDARSDERIPNFETLGKKRVGSVTGMFFDIVGPYTGILAVYFTNYRQLGSDETDLISALGEQGAIALHKSISNDEEMQKLMRQIVEGFALTIEAKDIQTHGHSQKVARFSRLVAEELGLPEPEAEIIYHAGLLHDIGKIGMEDFLLDRVGQLSDKEMDIIQKHPVIGAKIIKPLTFLNTIEPLILYHHERFDGTGYPEGKKGEDIPLGARILAVCDAFETMISGRPYMKKLNMAEALVDLQKGSGVRYDSCVVEALLSVISKHPDRIDSTMTEPDYLKNLHENIEDLVVENVFEKKLAEQGSIRN